MTFAQVGVAESYCYFYSKNEQDLNIYTKQLRVEKEDTVVRNCLLKYKNLSQIFYIVLYLLYNLHDIQILHI